MFVRLGSQDIATYVLGPYGRDLTAQDLLAAINIVTLFWTWSILFGMWMDTVPIMGLPWKPYVSS